MSRSTELVEAKAEVLDVLLPRLQERREAIQKEVLKYGEAPAGIKEVFELCRGFERAYVNFVNESPVASKIKESFMSDKGLAGMVRKAPIEKVYDLGNVKQIARQADGYQPHLMSPEAGLRQLASESLDFVAGPVNQCVFAVYTLLLNAAREATEKAGSFTEAALMGNLPMMVPEFKNVVMPAIVKAMDEWRHEAEKMSMMLVEMERTFLSAGFFRHTMYNRANKIKQQLALQQAAAQPGQPGAAQSGSKGLKNFFPAFGASSQATGGAQSPQQPGIPPRPSLTPGGVQSPQQSQVPTQADGASDGSAEEAGAPDAPAVPSGGAPAGFSASDMSDPNSFLAATFEKYNANDNAFLSVAASLRWQKRFFIFSEAQRALYYFKNAEDVSKGGQPRGMVHLSDCVVEDLDSQGAVRTSNAPVGSTLDKANMVIRIRHKDPRQATVKDHSALILRADTYEQKLQWLSKLSKATQPAPPPRPGKDGNSEGGGTVFSSFGGSLSNTTPEDMSWTKELDPIIDTHLGEGSAVFRADTVRDADGRLLPAPVTLINPMRLTDKLRKATGQAAAEARADVIMEQFAGDMSIYTRMVCDTVVTTVPKAIVHCLIRKSEKNLLERLFTVIHHLTPPQLEALLKEEDTVIKSRKEARSALEDCKAGIFVVQQVMERRNMTNQADRTPTVSLPANCFGYSGMPELLTKEQREYYEQLFSSEFAPEAMKSWTVPPVRALMPMPSTVGRGQRSAPPPHAASGGQRGAPPPPGAARSGGPPPVPQRLLPGQAPLLNSQSIRRAPPPVPGQQR